jgi:hypothetical protein
MLNKAIKDRKSRAKVDPGSGTAAASPGSGTAAKIGLKEASVPTKTNVLSGTGTKAAPRATSLKTDIVLPIPGEMDNSFALRAFSASIQPDGGGSLTNKVAGNVTDLWSGPKLRTVIPVDPSNVTERLVEEFSVIRMWWTAWALAGCANSAATVAIAKATRCGGSRGCSWWS